MQCNLCEKGAEYPIFFLWLFKRWACPNVQTAACLSAQMRWRMRCKYCERGFRVLVYHAPNSLDSQLASLPARPPAYPPILRDLWGCYYGRSIGRLVQIRKTWRPAVVAAAAEAAACGSLDYIYCFSLMSLIARLTDWQASWLAGNSI